MIARLRLLAVLFTTFFFFSSSAAQGDRLFTSSVTYCEPPKSLFIETFDVSYFAKNRSVSFNITASSVLPDVAVSANLLLNTYGMNPVNLTLDLCQVLGGALCPFPIQEFSGHDSLTIPDSFSSKIPGIAYKIPDLEAYAQFKLTETDTGEVLACVQATLSNGWSTYQPAVEWTTGGIAIATLLAAIWQSIISPFAPLPFRLIDMLSLYQTIAATGFFNLNYPTVYRTFTTNFGWAMSLFASSHDAVQDAINDMRARTGGGLANSTSASPVGLVNRRVSPWSGSGSNNLAVPQGNAFALPEFSKTFISTFSSVAAGHSSPVSQLRLQELAASGSSDSGTVQVVTEDSSNVLQAGVPIYVNSLHISTANAFMTVFICTLILIAIASFVFAAGYGVLYAMERFNLGQLDRRLRLRYAYPSFVRAWALRLALIMFFPIVVFSLYQWTLKDSWVPILLSVISFLAITAGVTYPFWKLFRHRRSTEETAFYSNTPFLRAHGPVFAQYRVERHYFFLFYVVSAFLKAIFIAAAKSRGLVQVILVLLVEIGTLIGLVTLRPHKTRGGDVFSTFLAIVRVVTTGLLFAFVESIGVKPIPRVAIGIVIAVIFSVSVIVMVLNVVFNLGLSRLWRRKGNADGLVITDRTEKSADDILEKGEKGSFTPTTTDSESVMTRARNPTPDRNIPLDPSVIQHYPATPSTGTSPTDSQSTRIRDSASTTNFGNMLPRRWSITPLHTPTSSSLDHSHLSTTPPQVNILGRTSEESSSLPPHSGSHTKDTVTS
ncbi:hypothetical protein V5O48_006458 [Marasmius crinis-equi]|uniref:ML-like domain-containing protein n=1 Tax=Marasmius crinis-equi TaxID=585013 RepID=A0ABR3FJE1_9AGAR